MDHAGFLGNSKRKPECSFGAAAGFRQSAGAGYERRSPLAKQYRHEFGSAPDSAGHGAANEDRRSGSEHPVPVAGNVRRRAEITWAISLAVAGALLRCAPLAVLALRRVTRLAAHPATTAKLPKLFLR